MNTTAFRFADDSRPRGPSVAEVLAADGDNPPACLFEQSPYRAPLRGIDKRSYHDRAWFAREIDHLWRRVWQMACREEEIPEPGDYLVYDVAELSIVVVRTEDGTIAAFWNSCLHRGTQLAPSGSEGSVREFRCPYHDWRYALDGRLAHIPCRWDFPQFEGREARLPPVKVDTWGGFVFVNPDPQAGPLAEYLGILPRHFAAWPLERRRIGAHVAKVIPCNWKAGIEAFLEGYHVAAVHPQALAFTGEINGQLDVWEPHVSRMISNLAQPSPRLVEGSVSEQHIVDALAGFVAGDTGKPLAGTQGARAAVTAALRQMLTQTTGVDHAGYSTAEITDAINYFVFPNLMPWAGFGTPLVYRVRPHGNDPDRAILDVYLLYQAPADGSAPPVPPTRWLAEDEPWSAAAELGGLGPIFDQDAQNFGLVQRGLKAGGGRTIDPSNYQESRIRHLHDTLARYLGEA